MGFEVAILAVMIRQDFYQLDVFGFHGVHSACAPVAWSSVLYGCCCGLNLPVAGGCGRKRKMFSCRFVPLRCKNKPTRQPVLCTSSMTSRMFFVCLVLYALALGVVGECFLFPATKRCRVGFRRWLDVGLWTACWGTGGNSLLEGRRRSVANESWLVPYRYNIPKNGGQTCTIGCCV